MLIERDELCALIPHGGTMCLLDGVQEWDDTSIVCVSNSHRSVDNPLRSQSHETPRSHQALPSLAVIHAVEYGAQAMAVHGGLLARKQGGTAAPGYLAALRDVQLHVSSLDAFTDPLRVEAEQVMAGAGNLMYNLRVSSGGIDIVSARATVITAPQ